MNSAVAWINKIPAKDTYNKYVSEFFPKRDSRFSCNFENRDYQRCNSYWVERVNGSIENSLNSDLGPVFDRRWEEFQIFHTDGSRNFKEIAAITDSKNFQVYISIRTKEGHIYLCDNTYPPKANCYWILINAWSSTRTGIRKCKYGTIPQKDTYPQGLCADLRDEFNQTSPDMLELKQWSHFFIKRNNNNILVYKLGIQNPILNYTEEEDFFEINRILVLSRNKVSGYWKVHNYDYLRINKILSFEQIGSDIYVDNNIFCGSLFVAMCSRCQLIVYIMAYNQNFRIFELVQEVVIVHNKSKQWQEERFLVKLTGYSIRLHISTLCDNCNNPFWALDSFEMCAENEIRVLKGSLDLSEVSCEVISSSLQVKYTTVDKNNVPDSSCGLGMFGNACLKCSTVFGFSRFNCDQSIICGIETNNENVCKCSMGYVGEECQNPCFKNFYGYGCQQQCGYCKYPPCHPVTGMCDLNSCLHEYTGYDCKLPPSPVLLYPPVILQIKHTSIVVQIQNSSYEGAQEPSFYKIQYKIVNANMWKSTEEIAITDEEPVEIEGLDPLTFYYVRAILLTANGTSFERDVVPQTNATTTCKLIMMENIQVQTLNTSATISFKSDAESCPSSGYQMIVNNQILRSDIYTFELVDLKPFTRFTARISSIYSKETLNFDFNTEEGASTKVEMLKATAIDEQSIQVNWVAPLEPGGIIKYYSVTYQHLNYLGCAPDNKIPNLNSQKTLRELNNSILINNLIPFSQYRIEVIPYTVMLGEVSATQINTRPTDTPTEAELPSIKEIKSESTKINIFFDKSNCTTMKGLLDYYVTFQCNNNWCSRFPTNLNFSSISYSKPLVLSNLLPYSNYTVTINIGRVGGKMSQISGVTAATITSVEVPNMIHNVVVFTKDENSISLRFPPPFPPTGILEEYFITYCYIEPHVFRNDNICFSKYKPASSCKLWSAYQCIIVDGLIKDKAYTLLIQARNRNTNYNSPTTASATTTQSASNSPTNLTATWDDYYNLTLSWMHPSITNGPLTKFVLKIFTNKGVCSDESFPVSERDYQLSYQYTIQINSSCYSSKLVIYVHAHNILEGSAVRLEISSPPTTPYLIPEPIITSVSNTTVSLDLKGVSNLEYTVKIYIFVLNDLGDVSKTAIVWNKSIISEETSNSLIAELDYNFYRSSRNVFTIGDGINYSSTLIVGKTHNKPLSPSTGYIITIILVNDFDGLERHNRYILNATTIGHKAEPNVGMENNGLFALLLLILLPIIIWIAISYYRKKKTVGWNSLVTMVNTRGSTVTNPDIIPLTTNKVSLQPSALAPTNSVKKEHVTPKKETGDQANMFSKPIKIMEFENYVKESIENGELERQHQLFPRGQTKPWNYGILPQNKSKNRYNNLVAYDHTRVKLEKIDNDEFSDYINANYIEGYKTSKAYIATQGPKPATVNDFWRMIWQENVSYIVMLANVIEGGKKKSEQYWPNLGEPVTYGNIQVEYLHSQVYADYEYRTFLVQRDKEERTVEQLHFVSWPDHGVPLYSQSLVPFLRKLLTIPQGKAPVVVHCSAGVGRTGTIILCDLCLRMAAREGLVDILKHQHNLRQQRANLVDNVEQYKLAHLVLLECLIAPQTNLSCDESVAKAINKIIESNSLQHHMEYLKNTEWQDHAMQAVVPITPKVEWTSKNRFQEIIPSGYGRVYISRYPTTDEHSDYINAVEVDGFRAPQRFIATQQPLPNTVCDFWRMVDEKEVSTIVCLNRIHKEDSTSCKFWPTKIGEEINPVPYITLRFHNKVKNEAFNLETIILNNTKNKKSYKRTIHLICLKEWPPNKTVPDNMDNLLSLWEETERVSRGNTTPIVVTCHNGSTACGLFLALTFLIEKINLEQQCDVCLAVRTVRRNRKEFVTNKEQFIFLYQTALLYLSQFSLYSNFTPASTSNNN